VYKRNSDEHKSLFPNEHENFHTGTYDVRIMHIETLLKNMSDLETLDAAKVLEVSFLEDYATTDTVYKN
jgi:hypothetical protein